MTQVFGHYGFQPLPVFSQSVKRVDWAFFADQLKFVKLMQIVSMETVPCNLFDW